MAEKLCRILTTGALHSIAQSAHKLDAWLSLDFGNENGNGGETLPCTDNWSTLYLEVGELNAGI
jgi:hypothetical protein